MSPDSGVQLFTRYITPMADRVPVVCSPATTSDPNGKVWMTEFYAKCGPDRCRVSKYLYRVYNIVMKTFMFCFRLPTIAPIGMM